MFGRCRRHPIRCCCASSWSPARRSCRCRSPQQLSHSRSHPPRWRPHCNALGSWRRKPRNRRGCAHARAPRGSRRLRPTGCTSPSPGTCRRNCHNRHRRALRCRLPCLPPLPSRAHLRRPRRCRRRRRHPLRRPCWSCVAVRVRRNAAGSPHRTWSMLRGPDSGASRRWMRGAPRAAGNASRHLGAPPSTPHTYARRRRLVDRPKRLGNGRESRRNNRDRV
mmetsp:Transcript_45021/g.131087  ORF Transcript_45021/g.131087 Transcript_45021/m.131087 type:complete len:221 (-) Transcript_45021:320-982(-)